MSAENRAAFIRRGRSILNLAWDLNGTAIEEDPIVSELRTLNGLLAIAITQTLARPYTGSGITGSSVNLSELLRSIEKGESI